MNRNEIDGKWAGFCADFIPPKPEGYRSEDYVFSAVKERPSFDMRKTSPDDSFVRLRFHDVTPDRGLGKFGCPGDRLKELHSFLKLGKIRMAFDYEVGRDDPIHVVRDADRLKNREVWFLGDIHGDVFALRSALAYINSNALKDPVYVFLGDLFDRNDYGLDVLVEVVTLLKEKPSSVFLVAGNHDDGLARDGSGFKSSITPQQFTDYLNGTADADVSAFVGDFIGLVRNLPIGILFPDGLMVTHGGVPARPERSIKNVWEGMGVIEIKEAIAKKRHEFLMNRFQGEVSLGSKLTPEFSWVEIINFGKAMEKAYGVPVRRLLRGHDHCGLSRHEWTHSTFRGSTTCSPEEAATVQDVLTMTTMALADGNDRYLPSFHNQNVSYPSVARYDQNQLPRVHSLMVAETEVADYYREADKVFGRESAERALPRLKPIENELVEAREEYAEACRAYELEKTKCDRQQRKVDDLKPEAEKRNRDYEEASRKADDTRAKVERLKSELAAAEKSIAELKATEEQERSSVDKSPVDKKPNEKSDPKTGVKAVSAPKTNTKSKPRSREEDPAKQNTIGNLVQSLFKKATETEKARKEQEEVAKELRKQLENAESDADELDWRKAKLLAAKDEIAPRLAAENKLNSEMQDKLRGFEGAVRASSSVVTALEKQLQDCKAMIETYQKMAEGVLSDEVR